MKLRTTHPSLVALHPRRKSIPARFCRGPNAPPPPGSWTKSPETPSHPATRCRALPALTLDAVPGGAREPGQQQQKQQVDQRERVDAEEAGCGGNRTRSARPPGGGGSQPRAPHHRPLSLSAVGAVRVTAARLPPPRVGERPRSVCDVSLLPGAPCLTYDGSAVH